LTTADEGTALWLAVVAIGAYHGLNPAMGWPLAVAHGLERRRSAAVFGTWIPLGIGHVLAMAMVLVPFALHEGLQLDFSPALSASIAWLIVVNSVGGFGLLFVLLRRGAANRVAQLFFLIPPVTAVISYAVLGEQFSVLKLTGFAVAAGGVYLGTRPAR